MQCHCQTHDNYTKYKSCFPRSKPSNAPILSISSYYMNSITLNPRKKPKNINKSKCTLISNIDKSQRKLQQILTNSSNLCITNNELHMLILITTGHNPRIQYSKSYFPNVQIIFEILNVVIIPWHWKSYIELQ